MYYFAYGPDLNKAQMRERCSECKPKFSATLPNYRLVFVGWSRVWRGGMATVRPVRGEKVLGGLYEVPEAELRRLDKAQGCPEDYTRVNVTVFDEGGEAVEAMTYVKVGLAPENAAAKEYLALIQRGYRDWGLV